MSQIETSLLILSFALLSTPAFAAPLCANLFTNKPSQSQLHKETASNKLVEFFKDKTDLNYNESIQADLSIHQWVLSIAADPKQKAHLPELIVEIEKLVAARPYSKKNPYDAVRMKLTSVQKLLKLSKASVSEWFDYLKKDDPSLDGFNLSSTAGLLLEQLPKAEKAELLEKLGDIYARTKNRDVVQAIHILLNPKALYADFKKQGKSDRDFYNSYLDLMKKYVFSHNTTAGGYEASLAIQSAITMQEYLKTKIDMQSLNFFGSIPNGFAREKSDYDVFNHPLESHYPKLKALAKKNEGNWKAEDPFENLRYQLNDPVLEKMLQKNIAGTPWKWHLENKGDHAHEHFGAQSHVFSFHITKDKISLRFYPNYIRKNAKGQELQAWDYIDLNVTD